MSNKKIHKTVDESIDKKNFIYSAYCKQKRLDMIFQIVIALNHFNASSPLKAQILSHSTWIPLRYPALILHAEGANEQKTFWKQ